MADNMLIDGLIKFCDEKSKNIKLKAEPQVFVEIKQALEELRIIKSDGFTDHLLNMGYTKGIKDGYAKGIDEFYDEILNFEDYIEPIDISDFGTVLLYSGIDITNMIVKIKAQLKAGGIDG